MASKPDLPVVFGRLKKILAPYAEKMVVASDTDQMYILNTGHFLKKKYPLMFAAVRLGKNYVSYHLMSLYMSPDGQSALSPELNKRMQGKACFNFKEVDEKLFKELAKLTKAGAKRFTDKKFLESLNQIRR